MRFTLLCEMAKIQRDFWAMGGLKQAPESFEAYIKHAADELALQGDGSDEALAQLQAATTYRDPELSQKKRP